MNLFITSNPSCAPNDALKIKLNKAFIFLCEEENITNCSINLKIMDDMEMQKLNKDFRSINKPTNVLSFANEDISKEHTGNLGDIAISYEEFSNSNRENYLDGFIKIFIHGFLHLLNFDHKSDKDYKLMNSIENKIYQKIKG